MPRVVLKNSRLVHQWQLHKIIVVNLALETKRYKKENKDEFNASSPLDYERLDLRRITVQLRTLDFLNGDFW